MLYEIEAIDYGRYDVLVCGAGTAGVFAAIAAARNGAKTLLIERSFSVGGMLTVGEAGITKFTEHCKDSERYKKEVLDVLGADSKRVQVVGGLPLEFVERMIKVGTACGTHGTGGSYVFTDKCEAQWTLMEMLEEAGVEILYDTRVCMAIKDAETIIGVVVCNKNGFLRIMASRVIDATGDADVAAYAGVPFHVGASEADRLEVPTVELGQTQAFGTMYRVRDIDYKKLFDHFEKDPTFFRSHPVGRMSLEDVRKSHENGEMAVFCIKDVTHPCYAKGSVQVYNLPTDGEAVLIGFTWCGYNEKSDGLNAACLSKAQKSLWEGVRRTTECLRVIPGMENIKITYIPDVGVRETRHIEGEYSLSTMDIVLGRKFEDSIGCGGHPVDISPTPKEVEEMDMNHWRFYIPYRIMVPLQVENLLVTGRCVSASRVASGAVRPTAQCMVMGEAAGTAAALSIKKNVTCRELDVKELQQVLLANNVIL